MSQQMTHDQKETAIEFVRAKGTLKAGANAAGVTYQTLRNVIRKSPIFQKRIAEAQIDGKSEIGDRAVENIKDLASLENKDVRSRLTANMSLANWAVPGFRGESKITGAINHNIKVQSALPRPDYKKLTPANTMEIIEVKPLRLKKKKDRITEEDKAKLRALNRGII